MRRCSTNGAPVADLRAHAAAERRSLALDGILIGASDGPFLAMSMVAAFVACTAVLLAALVGDWGIRGVWAALVVLIVVRLSLMTTRFRRRRSARHGLGVATTPSSPFAPGRRTMTSPGALSSIQVRLLRREARAAGSGCRDDDAVERLDVPEAAERVDRGASALDARIDRDVGAPCSELHRFEDRHCATELAVLNRSVEAVLERHDHEVRGHEHGVLGAGDAKRCLEGPSGRAGDR